MSALREVFARFGVDFEIGPLAKGAEAVSGMVGRLTNLKDIVARAAAALSALAAQFGINLQFRPVAEAADETSESVGGLIGKLQTLAEVVAGAAIIRGVQQFASEFAHAANEIEDTAAVLGMTTQALQEWRHAAELSGVDAGALDGSFLRLQDQMASGAPAFRRLGVSVRDASGRLRSAGDVLSELADPIAALPTDAERTGVLMDLLGRSGARLGPLFAQGSVGIAALREEFQRLGGGVTDEAIEAAAAYGDATDRLNTATLGLKSRIGVFLLPALERLVAALTEGARRLSAMTDRGRIAEVTLIAIGAAAAVAGAETAAAWIAAAAPFVALAIVVGAALLIFEDLWVGLDGGRSTLADLGAEMEAWEETATGAANAIAIAWEAVAGTIRSAVQAFHDLTGLGVDLTGGDGDMAISNDPSAEAQAINARVQQRREGLARLGIGEGVMSDSFERFLSAREVRGAAPAPQVTQTVRIDRIDANGLTPAQVTASVEAAVSRALSAQAGDTLDALGQGT